MCSIECACDLVQFCAVIFPRFFRLSRKEAINFDKPAINSKNSALGSSHIPPQKVGGALAVSAEWKKNSATVHTFNYNGVYHKRIHFPEPVHKNVRSRKHAVIENQEQRCRYNNIILSVRQFPAAILYGKSVAAV